MLPDVRGHHAAERSSLLFLIQVRGEHKDVLEYERLVRMQLLSYANKSSYAFPMHKSMVKQYLNNRSHGKNIGPTEYLGINRSFILNMQKTIYEGLLYLNMSASIEFVLRTQPKLK